MPLQVVEQTVRKPLARFRQELVPVLAQRVPGQPGSVQRQVPTLGLELGLGLLVPVQL